MPSTKKRSRVSAAQSSKPMDLHWKNETPLTWDVKVILPLALLRCLSPSVAQLNWQPAESTTNLRVCLPVHFSRLPIEPWDLWCKRTSAAKKNNYCTTVRLPISKHCKRKHNTCQFIVEIAVFSSCLNFCHSKMLFTSTMYIYIYSQMVRVTNSKTLIHTHTHTHAYLLSDNINTCVLTAVWWRW